MIQCSGMKKTKKKVYNALRWSEKFTGTDMVYLTKGASWLFSAQMMGAAASAITIIAFSRFAPKEVYGTYQYVLSYISILSVLVLPGVSTAVVQALSRGMDGVFWKSLRLKLVFSVLATIAGGALAAYYAYNGNFVLAISMAVLAVGMPFMTSFNLYRSVLISKKEFARASQYDTFSRIVVSAAVITAVVFSASIPVIIGAFVGSTVAVRGVLLWKTLTHVKLNKKKDTKSITYAKHLSLMAALPAIASQADKILVWHHLSAADLALYSVALIPVEQLRGVLNNVRTLAFPKFSTQSIEVIKKSLLQKIKKLELGIGLMALAYVIAAPWLFAWILPQYVEAVPYTQVLALLLIAAPRTLLSTVLKAHMRTKELYVIRIAGPAVRIALLLWLVPTYGLWGAVIGALLTEVFLYGLYLGLFKRL